MADGIVYHLVSGHAWFSGVFLLVIFMALDVSKTFDTRRKLRIAARGGLFLALLLGLLSGTPLSLWLAIPITGLTTVYVCHGFAHPSRPRRIVIGAATIILALGITAFEAPWHIGKSVAIGKAAKLYVVGDSITAGGFGEKQRYPQRLADLLGIEVKDLSHGGATAESALQFQAPRLGLDDPPAIVLLEIGGNDMLHGSTSAQFADNLEKLIVVARGDPVKPRTLAMLELPVTPGCWEFSVVQRHLCEKYGLGLIPKRVLAGILLANGNTVDGIHLSQKGHDHMAQAIAQWLHR